MNNLLGSIVGILVGLLSLGIMMFVHELGHYIVGRLLGFRVLEFSIFMGPRLLSWERKGIRYSLKLLPIGASCAFLGEETVPEGESGSEPATKLSPEDQAAKLVADREAGAFHAMPPWKRALTLVAGPAMNLLTAFLIMLVYFAHTGIQLPTVQEVQAGGLAAEAGLEAGDELIRVGGKKIRNPMDLTTALFLSGKDGSVPLVYRSAKDADLHEISVDTSPRETVVLGITFNPADPAEGILIDEVDAKINNEGKPNLRAGDRILKINGEAASYEVLKTKLDSGAGEALELTVLRQGEESVIRSKPSVIRRTPPLGISLVQKHDAAAVPAYSFFYGRSVLVSTARLLAQVFTGGLAVREAFSGPVAIVGMYSGIVAGQGVMLAQKILQWLSLTFMISLALGFGNLLPIPPLDGGMLVFVGIEKLLGRPLKPKVQNAFQMAGVALVLVLAVYVLAIDIWRLLPK